MFHKSSNASKVAVAHLIARMRDRGMTLFDTQMRTPATTQLGAVDISRAQYLKRVEAAVALDVSFV
jgi:leucyl/phenylalanyl-tRNA--protein transferase